MEIIRRGALLAGVLGAIWVSLVAVPHVVQVWAVDFAQEQKDEPKHRGRSQLPLDRYVAEVTRDRLVARDGAAWRELWGEATGQTVSDAFERRRSQDSRRRGLFFLPDEAPVNEIGPELRRSKFTYVRLADDDQSRCLAVSLLDGADASGRAPVWMIYPLRRYALPALLVAVVCYFILPWPRPGERTAYYSRGRAALPDVIGIMLTVVFFTPPLLILPDFGDPNPLGEGLPLTLIFWCLALCGIAIHAIAAWYTRLQVHVGEDRLRVETVLGARDIPFSSVSAASIGVRGAPKLLTRLGAIASLFSSRAVGPTLLAGSRRDAYLVLDTTDGRPLSLCLLGLQRLELLVDALEQAGVKLEGRDDQSPS